jgi:repressor of nif and glnA expression
MPDDTDRKMMEILRILADKDDVLGAKTIALGLKKKGYDLGERAVRYHMRILDEKGFTERKGYAGRKITPKGLKELEKGLIYDQVDFIFSKFENMIYNTTLDPEQAWGNVVVNTSIFHDKEGVMDILKEVFARGIAVSPFVRLNSAKDENDEEYFKLDTICGTTIDGMLRKAGIPVIPQYGGLVEVEDYTPVRFTELIAYKKTSMTPLEAFTDREMTSVLQVVRDGTGFIPANFRLIPESAREKAVKTFKKMNRIGVSGVMEIGESGKAVLGVPVVDDMVGIAVVGGINPLCAAKEAGFDVNIRLAEQTVEFSTMEKLVEPQTVLKKVKQGPREQVKFLLSKAWNLINMVDFDLETQKGRVIANISHVNKEDLEDALDLFFEVMSEPEYCVSKYFKIIPDLKEGKTSIATVCSLTIDGILNKKGIPSAPQYGGILETQTKNPRFIELTAYSGSSLDPHEIYLTKGMTSVLEAVNSSGRILASLKEIPYIARPDALEVLGEVKKAGFSILKVGKPSELIYNAKVEMYHAGIITPGGLNPIAAIREAGIHVEPKAVEAMLDISQMEEF